MSLYINYDSRLVPQELPVIEADNRGFRYGDGLFETLKVEKEEIRFAADHFERLFRGLHLLAFEVPEYFTSSYLADQILELCKKNSHQKAARVRLMVFRGAGGLYDPVNHLPHYIIQTAALPFASGLPADGLSLGIYTESRKIIDKFSHLKTNNYLPYLMAAIRAKQQGWNDCLVTNQNGSICDSTIANVFIIKGHTIITPSLNEGCIAGIMRKNLLLKLPSLGYEVREGLLSLEMVESADEVFLSNAVQGIRWVKHFNGITYNHKEITRIQDALIL